MRPSFRILLSIALLLWFGAAAERALAFSLFASASANAGVTGAPEDAITGSSDDAFLTDPTGGAAEVSAAILVDYTTLPSGPPTVITGSAHAYADPLDLRLSTSIEMQDYDGSIAGEGLFTTAFVSYSDQVFFDWDAAGEDLWVRPVFSLDGTIAASGGATSSLNLSYSWFALELLTGDDYTVLRRVAPGDGAAQVIASVVATPAFELAPGTTLDTVTRMVGESNILFDGLAPGDHAGAVDFDSTVTFLGFELFEDAALTTRYTGAISIQTADGRSVPIVPEPGTALLLGVGLAALRAARRPH